MYRLVIYSVTGRNPSALSGPGGLAVLEDFRGWGCHNVPLTCLCGHSRLRVAATSGFSSNIA